MAQQQRVDIGSSYPADHLLLKCRHEPDSRYHAGGYFRVLQLKQQPMLPCQRISSLCNLVPRTSYLDHVLPYLHAHVHSHDVRILRPSLLLLPRRPSGKIRLMLPTLGMCQIGAIILVNSKTQATFERANMILEEVRVFVEINGFQRKLPQTFSSIGIGGGLGGYTSTTKFTTRSILKIDVSDRLTDSLETEHT